MAEFQYTEYRLKPMFKDDFRLAWRKLYGQLKTDGHIGKAELYSLESSRFISIIEWKTTKADILEQAPYKAIKDSLIELLDKMDVVRPLKQVERTQ